MTRGKLYTHLGRIFSVLNNYIHGFQIQTNTNFDKNWLSEFGWIFIPFFSIPSVCREWNEALSITIIETGCKFGNKYFSNYLSNKYYYYIFLSLKALQVCILELHRSISHFLHWHLLQEEVINTNFHFDFFGSDINCWTGILWGEFFWHPVVWNTDKFKRLHLYIEKFQVIFSNFMITLVCTFLFK